MANEATLVENSAILNRTMIVGNPAVSISKGTLLKLSGGSVFKSAADDVYGGVAEEDFDSDNYSDATISVSLPGDHKIWDMTNTGESISSGQIASLSGANLIKAATEAEVNAGKGIGRLMEDASADEVVEVLHSL